MRFASALSAVLFALSPSVSGEEIQQAEAPPLPPPEAFWSFELGADGNEIDIRRTLDGVLVCFHDDMLDHRLAGFGDVGDLTWEELKRLSFRQPGPFSQHTRIPTLGEVFDLHRRYGGLMQLDVKRLETGADIAELLTAMDLWDHVVACGAPEIYTDPRFSSIPLYNLTVNNRDAVPAKIAQALAASQQGIVCDDPRGLLEALGRLQTSVSGEPHRELIYSANWLTMPAEQALIDRLNDAPDWDVLYPDQVGRDRKAQQITSRAMAGQLASRAGYSSAAVLAALEVRAIDRSLHTHWRFMGLDGQLAIGALLDVSPTPAAVDLAAFLELRDDPLLETVLEAL